ncbi:30S ribosomal protein S13 [bacterium]|nr:30S ribosomal protein S13 [bacterium]
MARIVGVDLPRDKRVEIGLTYVYGVGRVLALQILKVLEIDPGTRVKNLTETEISKLNNFIQENFKVEGDLRREIHQNIRRLMEIRSYRGVRHRRNLPVRGQRTRTNGRTKRGNRKTVGSSRVQAQKQKGAGSAKK